MSERTTLTVRVGDADRTRAEARERVKRLEAGGDVDDLHVLVVESLADLERLMRERNVELLRTIAREEPSSIRAAASLVDRDYREVHRNLTELEALGVVEFVEEGRSKRPVVRFDELEIELDVGGDAGKRSGLSA